MSRAPVCVECKHVDFTARHARRRPTVARGERPPPPQCSIIGTAPACSLHFEVAGGVSPVTGDSRRRLPVLCRDINKGSCPDFEEAQPFETSSWLPLGLVLLLLAVLAVALVGGSTPAPSVPVEPAP